MSLRHTVTVSAAVGLLASLAAANDYSGLYFRQQWSNPPIAVARIDPIEAPGKIGSHLHSFIGSDALAPTMDFAQTQTASCSQVYVKPDKSSYWQPKLFFQDPTNKTFTIVPEDHRVLYYQNRASDPDTGASDPSIIEEFPENFRMVAGDAMMRAPAATEQLQNAIQWFCHGPDVQSSGFPNFTSCPDGLAGSVQFPFCWNGDDYDNDNPQAHVSYPNSSAVDSGACPSTHPRVLPHIFIEFWFDTTSFDGLYTESDQPFVLSQGDPTGYGMHADFLNGWETGILENAMKTCDIGESGAPLSDCFDVYTDDERDACTVGPIVDEDVSGWLDALPGCNPLQYGPSNATMKTGCGDEATLVSGSASNSSYAVSSATSSVAAEATVAVATPSYEASAETSTAAAAAASSSSTTSSSSSSNTTLPSGWTSSGCHTDALTPRSLSGITFAWWGSPMTSSGCVQYCASKGYSIAGTENSSQCFCGNELSGSDAADADQCDMECDGDSSQVCGGEAVLSVFVKDGTQLRRREARERHVKKHLAGRVTY